MARLRSVSNLKALSVSAADFARRVFHHGYIVLVGIAGGLLGTYGDLFGGRISLPAWGPWSVVAASLLIASFWAFHDLRTEIEGESPLGQDPRFAALSDLLGHSLTVGAELSREREWTPLMAWKDHTQGLVSSAYGIGVSAHVFTPKLGEPRIYGSTHIARVVRAPLLPETINAFKALLGDMPSMVIRKDFDPSQWEPFDPAAFKAANSRPAGKAIAEEHWVCPWCSHEQSNFSLSRCDHCGAELNGKLVYRPKSAAV